MNIWVFVVACTVLIALVAHVFVGTKETATIDPKSTNKTLTANWVQAMCAFQMLSVDLLGVAGALLAIALFDFGPMERPAILLLSLLFFLWGLVWIVQMRWLNKPGLHLLRLPQWLIWFVCSGLLYLGS